MRLNAIVPLILTALALAACLSLLPAAQSAQAKDDSPAPGAFTLAGYEDAGEFVITLDEEPFAVSSFSWRKDGHIDVSSRVSTGRISTELTLAITPDGSGRWERVVMEASTGKVEARRAGADVTVTTFGEKTTSRVGERTCLFDALAPSLLSLVVAEYERGGARVQTMPVYVFPSTLCEATVERTGVMSCTVGGRELPFTRYSMLLAGVELAIWTDESRRVVTVDIPQMYCAITRRGYEGLFRGKDDPVLSSPTQSFRIREEVKVPLRDGTKTAVDLYLPDGEGRFPALLIRTPYNKDMLEPEGKFWARRGYVVAIADVRGRFASAGLFEPFVNEGLDGYDTVEWLASTQWCNGRVGMAGSGYSGAAQWLAAAEKPPHLVTIAPGVAAPPPEEGVPYEHGAFSLYAAARWMNVLETKATSDLTGAALHKALNADYSRLLGTLPVIAVDETLLGAKVPYWRDWILRRDDTAYWARADWLARVHRVAIPVFQQSGWFDPNGIATKLAACSMAKLGRPDGKLIIGPWEDDLAARMRGARDFGSHAFVDLKRERIRWFDYWLKGIPTGIDADARVKLFVMGENRWREGSTYPLEGTQERLLSLASAGKANSSKGDGRLTWAKDASTAELDEYEYDPARPTADPDFIPTTGAGEHRQVGSAEEEARKAQEYHVKVTDAARDILVYTTEPLQEPLVICGPVSATLFASTSAKDTDWFASLLEVDENGAVTPLVCGAVRARSRNGRPAEAPLSPGGVIRYEIDMRHTAVAVPRGHRLRVEVASAKFPTYSRNLNTGGSSETETTGEKASQRVYHCAAFPSCVRLSVLKE